MSTAAVSAPAVEVIADPPVLQAWADGSVRIDGTRLLLDMVIGGYTMGQTPEEIAASFGPRPVAPMYAALAYYFAHTDQVEAYLARREEQSARNQAEYERRFPEHQHLRSVLEARIAEQRAEHLGLVHSI